VPPAAFARTGLGLGCDPPPELRITLLGVHCYASLLVGRVALTATVAASSMAMLDATVVNVALPHIGEDLNASVSSLQWVLTGYLLSLASLILLGGALGDRYGRRKVFVIGTVWFAAASLLCGAAPNVDVLVAARVLQGVGAALLTPGRLAILQAVFVPADRAKAVGAWSGLGGVAGAVGPFAGGWLVDGPAGGGPSSSPARRRVGRGCALYAVPETRTRTRRGARRGRRRAGGDQPRHGDVGADGGRSTGLDGPGGHRCRHRRARGHRRSCVACVARRTHWCHRRSSAAASSR
jgi:hypothetical protein